MDNPAADWAECLARLPAVPGDKLKLLTDSLTLFKGNEATTVGRHLQLDVTCCFASCGSLGPARGAQVGNTPIGMSPPRRPVGGSHAADREVSGRTVPEGELPRPSIAVIASPRR